MSLDPIDEILAHVDPDLQRVHVHHCDNARAGGEARRYERARIGGLYSDNAVEGRIDPGISLGARGRGDRGLGRHQVLLGDIDQSLRRIITRFGGVEGFVADEILSELPDIALVDRLGIGGRDLGLGQSSRRLSRRCFGLLQERPVATPSSS